MADIPIQPDAGSLRLTSVFPEHIVTAHTDATSGVARSGCAVSGLTGTAISWFEDYTEVRIDGQDVTTLVDWEEFEITEGLSSEPTTCVMQIIGRPGVDDPVTPQWGQEVTVWLGGTNRGAPLFGGSIVRTSIAIRKAADETECLVTTLEATDWRWMMNRTALVTGTFYSAGVNTIVRKIIDQYTDSASGFTVGYIPSGLGDIESIAFDGVLVSEALTQIANAAGAVWVVDATKRITMFSPTASVGVWTDRIGDGTGLRGIGNTGDELSWVSPVFERDVSEFANRIRVIGNATIASAAASAGATEVEVEDRAPFLNFQTTSDFALIGGDDLEVAGDPARTAGPGTLTLTDALVHNVEVGDPVTAVQVLDNASDQTATATRFGGGQDGKVVGLSVSERLGGVDLQVYAASQLNALRFVRETLSCLVREDEDKSYKTTAFNLDKLVAGRMIFVNRAEWLTGVFTLARVNPLGSATNLAIRSVSTRFRSRRPENGQPTYEKTIEAARIAQPLSAIIIRALDHDRAAI